VLFARKLPSEGRFSLRQAPSAMAVETNPVRDHEPAGATAAGSSQRLWNVAGSLSANRGRQWPAEVETVRRLRFRGGLW